MNCKDKSFMTKKKAFTLIELLIVIAIIGILFIVLISKVDFATDKAKATGVQTDFRSFQLAFETVSRENAGFNTFGWDIGDLNGNRVRDSYDEGDTHNLGVKDSDEIWTGRKIYGETWTGIYTLTNPSDADDNSAIVALEEAINKNLDPKLHITINDDLTITMANGAQDPWDTEYHGYYITNAIVDNKDRGAIVIYSNGANQEWGSEHSISNGAVSISVPGNNKLGNDDYALVSCYTYVNGYGETKTITNGFSINHNVLGMNKVDNMNDFVQTVADKPIYNKAYIGSAEDSGIVMDFSLLFTETTVTLAASIQGQLLAESTKSYTMMNWDDMIEEFSIDESSSDLFVSLGWKKEAWYIVMEGTPVMLGFDAQSLIMILPSEEPMVIPMRIEGTYEDSTIVEGDYAYIYNETSNLYRATVLDKTKATYDVVKTSVNGKPVLLDRTYANCQNLVSITIPNVLLGKNIFEGSGVQTVTIEDGVVDISDYMFYYATNLATVNLPSSVKSIGKYAFGNCTSLNNIDLPINLETIGEYAFSSSGLVSITIPNKISVIETKTFFNCSSLTTVYLSNNLTTIKEEAFFQCTTIRDLYWTSNIVNVEQGAFGMYEGYTRSRMNVYIDNISSWTNVSFVSGVMGSCPCFTNATLYFNGVATSNLVIPYGVTKLSYTSFTNCIQFTSVTIPTSVTNIEGAVFMGCTNITSIFFEGTMAQWDAITKGGNWNRNVSATYVQCSDGQIVL